MIFFWSSKGTHTTLLENEGIHVHLRSYHRTVRIALRILLASYDIFPVVKGYAYYSSPTHTAFPIISYSVHFVPKSFRTSLVISYRTHFSSSRGAKGISSVSVCLSVCLLLYDETLRGTF